MNVTKPPRCQIWLEKARDDLGYAQGNLTMRFYSQVCFLTQQSAEKALKAYLIYKGISPSNLRIHVLPRLLEQCLSFDSSFGLLKETCQILNRYYIPTRYPPDAGPLGEFNEKEAEEALKFSKEVIEFIESKIIKK